MSYDLVHSCLRIGAQLLNILRPVGLPQMAGPRPHCTDVEAESLLMGCRGHGEWVVLVSAQFQASYSHPLP